MTMTSSSINPQDHIGLAMTTALWAARRWGGEWEEYFGVSYEALCDAARTFDPTRGYKFSTLAVRTMRWKLYMNLMSYVGHKRKGNGWIRRPKALGNYTRPVKDQATDLEFPQLTEREEETLRLIRSGMKIRRVAEYLGVTHQNIYNTLNRVVEKTLKFNGSEL